MAYKLIVVHSFKKFVRGQEITDPTEVAKWLKTHPRYVVKVPAPNVAAPVSAKA
jgi:hypothetical protein